MGRKIPAAQFQRAICWKGSLMVLEGVGCWYRKEIADNNSVHRNSTHCLVQGMSVKFCIFR